MSQRKLKKWFSRLIILALLASALFTLTVAGAYWHYSKNLPDFREIGGEGMPLISRVYDRHGTEIGRFFEQRRTLLDPTRPPELLIQAILAAEDADFYEHQGLDYRGILRAIYNSFRAGRLRGSGSTITQQTVKNLLLSQEKSLRRKIREIILTRRIESHLDKQEILTLYLNTIYLGHGRYGVREAARFYFGREAHELSLVQAATLAGLIQSPERHSPRKHPDSALRRRRYVLREMWENRFIDEARYRAALDAPLELASPPPLPESPRWFLSAIREKLIELYGEERLLQGGLEIHTTLSLPLQKIALEESQRALRELDRRQRHPRPQRRLRTLEARGRWREEARRKSARQPPRPGRHHEGLLLQVDDTTARFDLGGIEGVIPRSLFDRSGAEHYQVGGVYRLRMNEHQPATGPRLLSPLLPQTAALILEPQRREILALVGGWSPESFPYNRVLFARRQPGSAFKAFVFGAAIQSRHFTAGTIVLDSPEVYSLPDGRQWSPQNYDRRYRGPVSFREALARSLNTIAVRTAHRTGLDAVRAFAESTGLSGPFVDNLTIALGSSEVSPLELINSYATFADEGRVQSPRWLLRVLGPEGRALPLPAHPTPQQAIDPAVNWILRDMMRSVVQQGTGRRLAPLGLPLAGKTGTSNDAKDAWFIGLLPRLVVGVWVGFDQPRSLGRREGGSRSALPIAEGIFRRWRADAIEALIEWDPPPEGVRRLEIEPAHNLRAHDQSTETREEYYLQGTEPREEAPRPEQMGGDDFLFGGD